MHGPLEALLRYTALIVAVTAADVSLAAGQAADAPEPPPRLEATAQFAFLDTKGNASAQSLGAGGSVTWRPDPWTYAGKLIFAQNASEDELNARSLAAAFRASRALNARASLYGQYDFLRDVFAGVDQRHVAEGGGSYTAFDARGHRLRVDAGLGYLDQRGGDDTTQSATVSLGAAYRFALSTTSEITYDPRILQPLDEGGTLRFDHNAALTVAVNTFLSFKLSHILRYSADPPAGFDTTDRITAVSLVAKVRRPR